MSVDPSDAQLDWQDGQPVSRRFGDVYFSRTSGIQETRHVFLRQNRLAERFAALPPEGRFTIGETGFGTGLSFVCAWQLFEQTALASARLRFVSTERYPLSTDDLAASLALWPELAGYARELITQYGPMPTGWHRLSFAGGRVLLTLLVGDARQMLDALQGRADAWFLDGFAPAKNPELWQPNLLRLVAARSRPGATVATYTSAGHVRRGLGDAGFRVEKVAGFGAKREMLRGELPGEWRPVSAPQGREVVVIGGGLAGTASAFSLAQRGWRVTLVEQHDALASAASGNPQGVLYARLSPNRTLLSRLVLAGYQYTLRLLREVLPCDGEAWSDCPVLQLAHDEVEVRRQIGLLALDLPATLLHAVDADEASALAGIRLTQGGLCFPCGGWVYPPALCRALTGVPGIEVRTGQRAFLRREEGAWQVLAEGEMLARAPAVVLAIGAESPSCEQTNGLPLRVNRGQLTFVPATPASARLSAVLCGESYVAPARSGVHTAGATFARDFSTDVTAADHIENVAMLARLAPALFPALGGAAFDPKQLAGRAALRCTTPDYLPLIGPIADGLYVSTAHGSRGLITAPLAAEVLAAHLEDEPAALPVDLIKAASPKRFLPN